MAPVPGSMRVGPGLGCPGSPSDSKGSEGTSTPTEVTGQEVLCG